MVSHREALQAAARGENDEAVFEFVQNNPRSLCQILDNSSILAGIVNRGNEELLDRLIDIRRVYFDLNVKVDSEGRTMMAALDNTRNNGNIQHDDYQGMQQYILFLNEWDRKCELAKNQLNSYQGIDTRDRQLWSWLRRNSHACYRTPPSRRWSIAMQVVFYGDISLLTTLLQTCPSALLTSGDEARNPWLIPGNDGETMLSVAESQREIFPQVHELAVSRTTPGPPPDPPAPPAPSAPPAPQEDPLRAIREQWPNMPTMVVLKGMGVCSILGDDEEVVLYRCSRDCRHAFSEEALRRSLETSLDNGPFPVRCPGCVAAGIRDRGIVTRSALRGLVEAGVLDERTGQRLLLQQQRNLADEESMDLQFSLTKPCPNCSAAIAHYKNHGCHHIAPGTGCSVCHHHFCYVCLTDTGLQWPAMHCPEGCQLFCDDVEECDCPICPECTPGNSCDACDGCSACE